MKRRQLLKGGVAATLSAGLNPLTKLSAVTNQPRILVVFELSGGNDGLNTVIPYRNDDYYRARPNIGLRPNEILKLDDEWGMNLGLAGLKQQWDKGNVAVIHGCGYERPSYSHFTSMAYWHTASPNSGDAYGWCGKTADFLAPDAPENFIINIDTSQSLAVTSRYHTPVVFDDPDLFRRINPNGVMTIPPNGPTGNPGTETTRTFLSSVAASAKSASRKVREACASYQTPVDYGIAPSQLDQVAACIAAGFETQIYYLAFRNNAFDTHVHQKDLHQRLLMYAGDAINGFLEDMERIGMAEHVTLMMFSEFGRRVGENANLGTDHGTANTMFLAGKPVIGGHYGKPPVLGTLDETDNLIHTTDFRRVYATAIESWLGSSNSIDILKGNFKPFPIFS